MIIFDSLMIIGSSLMIILRVLMIIGWLEGLDFSFDDYFRSFDDYLQLFDDYPPKFDDYRVARGHQFFQTTFPMARHNHFIKKREGVTCPLAHSSNQRIRITTADWHQVGRLIRRVVPCIRLKIWRRGRGVGGLPWIGILLLRGLGRFVSPRLRRVLGWRRMAGLRNCLR